MISKSSTQPYNQDLLRPFTCTICELTYTRREHAWNHVEASHFKGVYLYNCTTCGRTCDTRKGLQNHRYSDPILINF